MSEVERISALLRASVSGPAWHGDALLEVLKGISARDALRKPANGVHSAWEILNHIVVWERVVGFRVEGGDPGPVPDSEDWPEVGRSEEAWMAACVCLQEETNRLIEIVSRIPEEALSEEVPGQGVTCYQMIHGVIHHILYHAGQIALLKRLQSSVRGV